jgi:hypothetical protein
MTGAKISYSIVSSGDLISPIQSHTSVSIAILCLHWRRRECLVNQINRGLDAWNSVKKVAVSQGLATMTRVSAYRGGSEAADSLRGQNAPMGATGECMLGRAKVSLGL